MDYYGISSGTIRAESLRKLAQLAAKDSEGSLPRLVELAPTISGNSFAEVAISPREYETLVALCDATADIASHKQATSLLERFRVYLTELPRQRFGKSIHRQHLKHAPWTVLAQKLTIGITQLAVQFVDLTDMALDALMGFADVLFAADLELAHYLTLVGVLRGFIKQPALLTTADGFKVFLKLDTCIDNFDFLHEVEEYLSRLYVVPDFADRDYSPLLDKDYVVDFAPVLFLERLSVLMTRIAASVTKNTGTSLLEGILEAPLSPTLEYGGVGERKNSKSLDTSPLEDRLDVVSAELESTLIDGRLEDTASSILSSLSALATQKMEFLDRGELYIVYSTFSRLRLGYRSKAANLQVIGCGVSLGHVDVKTGRTLFRNCLDITDAMLDPDLGLATIQLGALLSTRDEFTGATLTRGFTTLVADPALSYCDAAARSVGIATRLMSQDAVVTTIYTLTNLLFASRRPASRRSSVALFTSVGDDAARVCENATTAIVAIARACQDETVATLAVTLLSQKAHKDAPARATLLRGLVSCAPFLPEREFVILVRLMHRWAEESNLAVLERARVELSERISRNSETSEIDTSGTPRIEGALGTARIESIDSSDDFEFSHYEVLLEELLRAVVSEGEVQELEHHRSHNEITAVAAQICRHLRPLAALLPPPTSAPLRLSAGITKLFRDFWFNLAVHGFSMQSSNTKTYARELERIAHSSPALASEALWARAETLLELNTILRRGSLNHTVKDHRHIVGDIFEVHRLLSYPKLMFLLAAVYVELLRVRGGDCATVLTYLSDPALKTSGVDRFMGAIAHKIATDYVSLVPVKQFRADSVAAQLTRMLQLCCHRLEEVQDAALQCCDVLVTRIPSALCHATSLYALFDILTLLFDALADADTHMYDPTTQFTAPRTGVVLLLPDDYKWRSATFSRFRDKARSWVKLAMVKCGGDTRALVLDYVAGQMSVGRVYYGVLFALEMAGAILPSDRELYNISRHPVTDLHVMWEAPSDVVSPAASAVAVYDSTLDSSVASIIADPTSITVDSARSLLSKLAAVGTARATRDIVAVAFAVFDEEVMGTALTVLRRPHLGMLATAELAKAWEMLVEQRYGLFSTARDLVNAEFATMQYVPTDLVGMRKGAALVERLILPHLQLVRAFALSFEAAMNQSDHLLKIYTRVVEVGLRGLRVASLHPYARSARFELVRFAFDVLNHHTKLGARNLILITELILDATLLWFRARAAYPFGGNLLKIKADYALLKEVARLMSHTPTYKLDELELKKTLLMFFLDDEISKMAVWLNVLNPQDTRGQFVSSAISGTHITRAYAHDPILAVNLALRYKIKNLDELLQALITKNPLPATPYPEAVQFFIGINGGTNMPTHHLVFWEALSPVDAITLFLPPFGHHPYILQYSMRLLEHHDVNLTFFYVPQLVQSLRFDQKGYMEKFILEAGKVSQLFAHQIIWNMLANSYKDEDLTEPDSLKPVLDRIQTEMKQSFARSDLEFYEREFSFFNEVTSISGKLKPYVKKSKAEKKVKIDEEMGRIEVLEGVYLPSNPDGVVIDINRKSGRPLQSHAKAPFMATFKIRKERHDIDDRGRDIVVPYEKWQSAIFKVGDDVRQDVLALQLISVFRSIWMTAGLDLYVYPNRVTATAPGCGVIDVLPNSISRDMLGREAVNGLYEYYVTKFGPETSVEYQNARNNLIKSLAAYLIISYILQFKDRHNGNIMYDDQGHILHIDFGFCFDIVPGGVRFEAAPFKLTHEMIMVLGGSNTTQAFKWFEELCVKGYLACRPHMETIVRCVTPMLESGLPCFKEQTIRKLRQRFVPGKLEREASLYMRGLVGKLMESFYTKGYDEFQRITNGIPY